MKVCNVCGKSVHFDRGLWVHTDTGSLFGPEDRPVTILRYDSHGCSAVESGHVAVPVDDKGVSCEG